MSKKARSPLERLIERWEATERAMADLRRSASENGHDQSRKQSRLIYLEMHCATLRRLRGEIVAIDPAHPVLVRQPSSLPTLDELIVLYERQEREDAWYVWRITSGIHPRHIPGLRREHQEKRVAFDAVWRDLFTRFGDDPRVQRLAASRDQSSG